MDFKITADNRPYLEARGKIVLNACPGSGKTTAVAFKLTKLTDECELKYGKFSGIACLSFTNTAKDEIGSKYTEIKGSVLNYPHLISTIDSFVNQYITLPFYHMLSVSSRRPTIFNTVEFINDMHLGAYRNLKKQLLRYSYPPSMLKIEIDGTYSWNGHKCNPKIADPAVFERFAEKYKNWQIDNGVLTNDDSTYLACRLIETYPEIARHLVERFPYIVIDEAQDTSEIQYKLFDLLVDAGLTNIEFVGDPYQSLYEFREARPDLFLKRFNDTAHWKALRFDDCRRSSQKIINLYSLFRSSSEKSIVSVCTHGTDHSVKILRYDENDPIALVERYEAVTGAVFSSQILVRGGTHLEKFGVKPMSEEPWKNGLAKMIINAKHEFEQGNIKSAIDDVRTFHVEINFPGSDYAQKRELVKTNREDINLNISFFAFLKQMPKLDESLLKWTVAMQALIKIFFAVDVNLELKQKGKAFYSQILRDVLFPRAVLTLPVSTIHRVKGKTFTSVLLVLSHNSSGQNISLSDFVQPSGLPSEKQRMLYVALSRPETSCFIAVPDKISEKQIRDKLGATIEFL